MTESLSKTRFVSGLQCLKKLWYESSKTIDPSPLSASDQLIFDRGREVEAVYRQRLENLAEVTSKKFDEAKSETAQLIKQGANNIYQATFIHDDHVVRVDVLERSATDSWNIIEIKMSSEVKDEHIPDAAFQKYVCELAGLKIDKCFVVHLNRACVFPDLSDLFCKADITEQVNEIYPGLSERAREFFATMQNESEPIIRIGKRCSKPHDCRFIYHCWQDVPKHSVFTVPRLSEDKINSLLDDNVINVVDIPDGFKLTAIQQKYVDLIKNGVPRIDRSEISKALNVLEFPLYFLDFEADRPPLPQYVGMHPYDLMPFQYSLHILEKGGNITHKYYLHEENTDCRPVIAEMLNTSIGMSGSVVVYNKNFEKGVLEDLAVFSPGHSSKLLSIRDRLWDQCDIFKAFYMHPDFVGSNSLKDVLQTVVPSLSYEDMEVRSGNNAVAAWVKMLKSSDVSEIEKLKTGLLEYCKLDSLAMVEIHKHLLALN